MLCPYCLHNVHFVTQKSEQDNSTHYVCRNPQCRQVIPPFYLNECRSCLPVVFNAVGFRQHGKTVYFAALFHVLRQLADIWPNFFTTPLNERALDAIYENADTLAAGMLPDSTPKVFPEPTMVKVSGMPWSLDRILLFYDTGGECFERPSQMVQYAGFLRQARTSLFLISLPSLTNPAEAMDKLLKTYLIGLAELKTDTRRQHLVVVYTQADEVAPHLEFPWDDLREYLLSGSTEVLAHANGYLRTMRRMSHRLAAYTHSELKAHEFLHAARANFRSVNFSIVSSLGSRPEGQRLPGRFVPCRVIDPLLWALEGAKPPWQQMYRRMLF